MIDNIIKGNIHDKGQVPCEHIVFGVSPQGARDLIIEISVNKANTDRKKIGDVISYRIDDKILHICVCFSLHENGFRRTSQVIEDCLNELDIFENETVAVMITDNSGIKIPEEKALTILGGIARSNKHVVFYYKE